jgi:hypothetical protein
MATTPPASTSGVSKPRVVTWLPAWWKRSTTSQLRLVAEQPQRRTPGVVGSEQERLDPHTLAGGADGVAFLLEEQRAVVEQAHMVADRVHRPSRRCQSDFFGGQAQRWSRGTPASACSMCRPQPAHVGLPHLLHSTRRHMSRAPLVYRCGILQCDGVECNRRSGLKRKNPGGHPGFFVLRRTAYCDGPPGLAVGRVVRMVEATVMLPRAPMV